jgi:hypothetical protein
MYNKMMGEQIGLYIKGVSCEDEGQATLITNAPNTTNICYMDIGRDSRLLCATIHTKKEADPLHFSNIPSNFGDETLELLVGHNTFPQNYVRKISDQEYDNCELQSESI